MQLVNEIFNNPQASFDPLNFVGIIITCLLSIYILKSETSISLIKERHDKLIFPLFNLLEPVLYQEPDIKKLNTALKFVDKNKNLADGTLIELCYFCSKEPSKYNFKLLCSYIDFLYDKSCRKLGLKTRSFLYRYSKNQFRSKISIIMYIIKFSLFAFIACFSIFLILFLLFIVILAIYEQTTPSNKILMLCFLAILLSAIYKYVSRNF